MRNGWLTFVLVMLRAGWASSATISVGPTDDWTKIEAAKAGDIVELAPGTYRFRVYLSAQGTATNPIVIRAKDPSRRPVWDLSGKPVSQWPGSYSAGDKGRGCWQVTGAHYLISGVEFRGCQDTASAGLRANGAGPLTIRDCLFANSTNGLTGVSEDLVVEYSEFFGNGKLAAGDPSHNLYIYGGVFTLRYSHVHDPTDGQNFHIRARQATIEYSWIARPASYVGDLMSCEYRCGGSGTTAITQRMLLRGNVIVQGAPKNTSQLVALYNDEPAASVDGTGRVATMELALVNNTIIGSAGNSRLVNMVNSSVATKVTLSNNVVYRVGALAVPDAPAATNWSIAGSHNWVTTGTATANLGATISGTDPGFAALGSSDFTLTSASACRGKGNAAAADLPTQEYYRDEVLARRRRPRATAHDIGAFEHGNNAAVVGPYDDTPSNKDAGVGDGGRRDARSDRSAIEASVVPINPKTPDPSGASRLGKGCGCALGDEGGGDGGNPEMLATLIAMLAMLWRWRSSGRLIG